MTDFGRRLMARLQEATDRNQQIQSRNERAKEKLNKAMPAIAKSLQGNQVVLAAMREIYGALEADGEELSTAIVELKEARDSLEMALNMLEQADFDFANIQTLSQDSVWLAEHEPTIKRALEIFNLTKTKQVLADVKVSNPKRFQALKELFND